MQNSIIKSLAFLLIVFLVYFLWTYLGPWSLVIFWILCGLIDVLRHKTLTKKVIKQYFTGKGILTWFLSPINLFTDLISPKNLHVYNIEDMPPDLQSEILEVKNLFDKNISNITQRFENADSSRTMLFYKWYDKNLDNQIPEFNREFKYVKTIGVSLFKEKTSTSRHFGPLRISFRMLYNFNKAQNPGSYIEADGNINAWKDKSLFIFDDTLIHQSFSKEDNVRYCAFIDIIRPSYVYPIMSFLLMIVSFFMIRVRGIFYKNWEMIQ
jgi:beta-hydroxylase